MDDFLKYFREMSTVSLCNGNMASKESSFPHHREAFFFSLESLLFIFQIFRYLINSFILPKLFETVYEYLSYRLKKIKPTWSWHENYK